MTWFGLMTWLAASASTDRPVSMLAFFEWRMDLGDLIALGGVIGAAIGLRVAWGQLKTNLAAAQANRKVQQGQFLLHLHDHFQRYDKIHRSLSSRAQRAAWTAPPGDDWTSLVQYLGLFERCEILIELGLLDADHFDRLYGYRLRNLVDVAAIRDKYVANPEDAAGWTDFRALWRRLDNVYQQRTGRTPSSPAPGEAALLEQVSEGATEVTGAEK